MLSDPEIVFRLTLGLVFISTALIGLPRRLRADRVGGQVSRRTDPRWFWVLMSIVGPPTALVCLGFIVQPRWVETTQWQPPVVVRWLGVPTALAGLALFEWMFRHLGLNVTSTSVPRRNAELITSGPYRWIRHPMYTAVFILVVAATLLTANLVVAFGGAGTFALLAARSRLEEKRLLEKFGAAYRTYQQRTGRFLP